METIDSIVRARGKEVVKKLLKVYSRQLINTPPKMRTNFDSCMDDFKSKIFIAVQISIGKGSSCNPIYIEDTHKFVHTLEFIFKGWRNFKGRSDVVEDYGSGCLELAFEDFEKRICFLNLSPEISEESFEKLWGKILI